MPSNNDWGSVNFGEWKYDAIPDTPPEKDITQQILQIYPVSENCGYKALANIGFMTYATGSQQLAKTVTWQIIFAGPKSNLFGMNLERSQDRIHRNNKFVTK